MTTNKNKQEQSERQTAKIEPFFSISTKNCLAKSVVPAWLSPTAEREKKKGNRRNKQPRACTTGIGLHAKVRSSLSKQRENQCCASALELLFMLFVAVINEKLSVVFDGDVTSAAPFSSTFLNFLLSFSSTLPLVEVGSGDSERLLFTGANIVGHGLRSVLFNSVDFPLDAAAADEWLKLNFTIIAVMLSQPVPSPLVLGAKQCTNNWTEQKQVRMDPKSAQKWNSPLHRFDWDFSSPNVLEQSSPHLDWTWNSRCHRKRWSWIHLDLPMSMCGCPAERWWLVPRLVMSKSSCRHDHQWLETSWDRLDKTRCSSDHSSIDTRTWNTSVEGDFVSRFFDASFLGWIFWFVI